MVAMTTATVAAPQGNQFAILLAIFLVISFATVAVYWNHERRMDRAEKRERARDKELRDQKKQLATLAYQMPALLEYLGVEINEPVVDDSPGHEDAVMGDDEPTEEFDAIPATVPDGIPLQVQSALIERHELMTPETAEKQRAARAAWVEKEMAKFDYSGRDR